MLLISGEIVRYPQSSAGRVTLFLRKAEQWEWTGAGWASVLRDGTRGLPCLLPGQAGAGSRASRFLMASFREVTSGVIWLSVSAGPDKAGRQDGGAGGGLDPRGWVGLGVASLNQGPFLGAPTGPHPSRWGSENMRSR